MTGDGDRDDEVDDGNGSDILMPKLTRETKDTRTRSESPAVSPTLSSGTSHQPWACIKNEAETLFNQDLFSQHLVLCGQLRRARFAPCSM